MLDNLVRGRQTNLAAALEDDRVSVVEGSVEDLDLLRELMKGTDYVFHLAALWLYECVHEPRKALNANVVGTYNVIEAAQEAGVKKVVYSSSASVYGNAVTDVMTEDHPLNNRTMYGATKIAGEQFFRAFHEQPRARLRRTPLHERVRTAYGLQGHVRERHHEGARPHRRWRARRSSTGMARIPTTSCTWQTSPGRTSCR